MPRLLAVGLAVICAAAPASAQMVDWADFTSTTTAAYPGGGTVVVDYSAVYRANGAPVPYVSFDGFPSVDDGAVEELVALAATTPFTSQFPGGTLGALSALAMFNNSSNIGHVQHALTLDFPVDNRAGGQTLVGLGGVYPNVVTPLGSRVNSQWVVTAIRCDGSPENDYSGWSSIVPPAGFSATDTHADAVFSTPVTGAATSSGYVITVGTLDFWDGNNDAVPALARPRAGTCYSRIIITRSSDSAGEEVDEPGAYWDTEYFKLYVGKVIETGILRLGKSLPHGRAVAGNQFLLRIAGGAADVTAVTAGSTDTPAQVATLDPAIAGTVYTLSEEPAGSPATSLSDYQTTYACTNAGRAGRRPVARVHRSPSPWRRMTISPARSPMPARRPFACTRNCRMDASSQRISSASPSPERAHRPPSQRRARRRRSRARSSMSPRHPGPPMSCPRRVPPARTSTATSRPTAAPIRWMAVRHRLAATSRSA